MNLDWVLGLPKSGVVILTKKDSVLINYTTSMGANLESLYNEFKGREDISMEVVSCGVDLETLKLHAEWYRDYYTKLGYKMMNPGYRKIIQYRVRSVPSPDFKGMDVELVTARGDSKVVGRFRNIGEAKSFIETYYGTDNPFRFPVYASNCDTKQLLLDDQKKMLELR